MLDRFREDTAIVDLVHVDKYVVLTSPSSLGLAYRLMDAPIDHLRLEDVVDESLDLLAHLYVQIHSATMDRHLIVDL